jgi:PhnB protein
MKIKPIPDDSPQISPILLYEDVAGALDWLAKAFGFEEEERYTDSDGNVNHASMTYGNGSIMMGNPGTDYKNPKHLGQATQILYVYVENVDKHYEQAKKAGAVITQEPADQFYGDRRYGASDPEGHKWYFASRVSEPSL